MAGNVNRPTSPAVDWKKCFHSNHRSAFILLAFQQDRRRNGAAHESRRTVIKSILGSAMPIGVEPAVADSPSRGEKLIALILSRTGLHKGRSSWQTAQWTPNLAETLDSLSARTSVRDRILFPVLGSAKTI
jgi:hypothetical protein